MLDLLIMLVIFIIAFAIGYLLISLIPSLLHTPLMSMTNAISAVTIIGALMIFAHKTDFLEGALGGLAVVCAMFNLVGGFVITHRMVNLFKKSTTPSEPAADISKE
ncbi:MAG: NAD(P) transhydrogenase subunit alpha [Desulfobacterales bacterium]|nr:NAD(P) transhydrogenase subunit alpha [Desulfobacterales bacterium]MBF0396800.1 NAD(P) transhydrogenase subunit alpha [Desulfobacterales bacterium]